MGNRCETGALDAGCSGGAISITGRGPSSVAAVSGAAHGYAGSGKRERAVPGVYREVMKETATERQRATDKEVTREILRERA